MMLRPAGTGDDALSALRGLVAIEPDVRNYDWGSVSAIPRLLGVEPTGRPVAELWFGAHPDGPSRLLDGAPDRTLADVVDADPRAVLGPAAVERFGPRLPFLLKVLAADRPLSLQVHPSISQARHGYSSELARGVAPSASSANYRDDNHKPELLCALSDFWALSGFRPVDRTVDLLDALGVADLAPLRGLREPGLTGPERARATVEAWLTAPAASRNPVTAAAVSGARRLADTAGAWREEARWCVRIADAFPGDAGIVVALLLNLIHLRPGQYIFVPVGQVHSYLGGSGIEIMANSDNVLRCGLTSKRVDVAELMAIADFTDQARTAQEPVDAGDAVVYRAPVEDFRLSRFTVAEADPVTLSTGSAQILLCIQGELQVSTDGGSLVLPAGRAAFGAAGTALTVTGTGSAFRATANIAA